MERLFPRVLVTCIGEGRKPSAEELATFADKVRREAFSGRGERQGSDHAVHVARIALTGTEVQA